MGARDRSRFTVHRIPGADIVTEVNALEVSEASISVTQYDLYRTEVVDQDAQHVERRERIESSALTMMWTADAPESDLDPVILEAVAAQPNPHDVQETRGLPPVIPIELAACAWT